MIDVIKSMKCVVNLCYERAAGRERKPLEGCGCRAEAQFQLMQRGLSLILNGHCFKSLLLQIHFNRLL